MAFIFLNLKVDLGTSTVHYSKLNQLQDMYNVWNVISVENDFTTKKITPC